MGQPFWGSVGRLYRAAGDHVLICLWHQMLKWPRSVEPNRGHGVKQPWFWLFLVHDLGRFLHPSWVAAPSFINEDHSRPQSWHPANPQQDSRSGILHVSDRSRVCGKESTEQNAPAMLQGHAEHFKNDMSHSAFNDLALFGDVGVFPLLSSLGTWGLCKQKKSKEV